MANGSSDAKEPTEYESAENLYRLSKRTERTERNVSHEGGRGSCCSYRDVGNVDAVADGGKQIMSQTVFEAAGTLAK